MKIFVPKETDPHETRVALDPAATRRLIALGAEISIEPGAGLASDHPDSEYEAAGAKIVPSRLGALSEADVVFRVRKPPSYEVTIQKRGAIHASFLDPFAETDLIHAFAGAGVTAISLEMIPRTTLAQKMDAISSQASLAGYVATIVAANRMKTILPMMMTPAGTIPAAKFFVLGIGVAGLQAIATARRLGARITAFDVRQEALEQAESLGAKALRIDLGDTGKAEGGYAKELSPEQLAKQRAEQAKVCVASDVVITTAKVFGRKPPILITADTVAAMHRGSVIVDLAAESGGNVEGVVPGEESTTPNGVRIVGFHNFEGRVATCASAMLASNFAALLEHCWDKDSKSAKVNIADPIFKGCVITSGGSIVHDRFQKI